MALNLREISGFCTANPSGGDATHYPNGKSWGLNGTALASSNEDAFYTDAQGHIHAVVSLDNLAIQRAFDIWNAEHHKKFVNLKTDGTCPNSGWTYDGGAVTKLDAQIAYVKVPSLCAADDPSCANGPIAFGYATYERTNFRDVDVPDLTPEGLYQYDNKGRLITITVQASDFKGDPFAYCSRFDPDVFNPDIVGPDGNPADSGLRIYDYGTAQAPIEETLPGNKGTVKHEGKVISVNDGKYDVRDCNIWRDVNDWKKVRQFDLRGFYGPYDPDVAEIKDPQDGRSDKGGLVLTLDPATGALATTYVGECHQYGKDSTGGSGPYSFSQIGPVKCTITDASGNVTQPGHPMCTGGSQLMDGNYPALPECP